MELARLRNLGPTSARWLAAAGITSRERLEELGAARAFAAVRAAGFAPSRNLLWALHGAIYDMPWNELPPELKRRLLEELEEEGSRKTGAL